MMLFTIGMFPLLMLAVSLALPADTGGNARSVRESTGFKASAFGLLSGIVVCTVKALFVFSSVGIAANFFSRFWSAFGATAVPFIVLASVFFLLFKGEPGAKVASFFFLFSAYWAVLLPYHVVSEAAPGFFELCVVPLLYAAVTADAALLAARLYAALEKKHAPSVAAYSSGFLLVFALVAAAEASRSTGGGAYTVFALIFFVCSSGIVAFCRGKKQNSY